MFKKVVGISISAALGIAVMTGVHGVASAADEAKPAAGAAVDYSKISPPDLVKQTPKGQLKNPYKDSQADIVAKGEHIFELQLQRLSRRRRRRRHVPGAHQ